MSSQTRLGLVRCDYCERQFNPHSAARHVPWCAKQHSDSARRQRLTSDKLEALQRYRSRINYRPSNRLQQQQQQYSLPPQASKSARLNSNNSASQQWPPPGERGLAGLAKRQHRSSIGNSSLSASSTNSAETSLGSSGTNSVANQRRSFTVNNKSGGRPQQANLATTKSRSGPIPFKPLKRSVSSLTLVKKSGTIIPTDGQQESQGDVQQRCDNADSRRRQQASEMLVSRAKSYGDLQTGGGNMGEIVELLVQRMDEIYKQNKLLLANLDAKSGVSDYRMNDDNDDGLGDRPRAAPAMCHHCKTVILLNSGQANYCHRCGCKLRASSPPTSTSISSSGAELG